MYSTKKLSALAVATIALFTTTAAMAGPMVVRATGPSAKNFPIGKAIAASSIPLQAGDAITVLDAGGTRVLKGPGNVAVSGSSVASGSGFGQLLANSGARQARTGATRSAIGGGPARSPNVWYIDASKSGLHCVSDPSNLTLWRPDSAEEGSAIVKRLSDGKMATVDFRAGQATRPWPSDEIEVSEGAQFSIELNGAKAPVTVKTEMLGEAPEEIEGIAASLMAKSCSAQMDVLVEGSKQEGTQVAVAN